MRVRLGNYYPKLSLPLSAINFESNGATVVKSVSSEGIINIKQVKIGNKYKDQVEIVSGLQENEIVVLKAGALVNEGDCVQPVHGRIDAL